MSEPSKTSVSEKIEDSVEGVLRFLAKLIRTLWILFSRPLSAVDRLLANPEKYKVYSRPLTFLSIGGFIFTLSISTYPHGFHNLFDIIWFDQEIKNTLYERWEEAFTVSGLLLAGFPVLVTVVVCSSLWSRVMLDEEHRHHFVVANSYLFGYQTFSLFLLVFLIIVEDVAREIFPPIEAPILRTIFTYLTIPLLVAAMISSFLMPTVGLMRWQYSISRDIPFKRKFARILIMPLYATVVFAALTYAASIPGAFQAAAEDLPDIELHYIDIPIIRKEDIDASEDANFHTSFDIVIENETDEAFIQDHQGVSIELIVDAGGSDLNQWSATPTIHRTGSEKSMILVSQKSLEMYSITAKFEMPASSIQEIVLSTDSARRNDINIYIEVSFSTKPLRSWQIATQFVEDD